MKTEAYGDALDSALREIERLSAEVESLRAQIAEAQPVGFFDVSLNTGMWVESKSDTGTPLYLHPAADAKDAAQSNWLEICAEELERGKINSLPQKVRFAEKRGFKDLDAVHAWMIETRKRFVEMVEKAMKGGA